MANEPVLGRLRIVPPREVWPHEALDFTPWLLNNVDVLSDLLGMDLILEAAEHPVGGFSLDLIGKDQATDRVVIVENQLEGSDHTHLGQILTYAAGTDPTTIVWVNTGFRPEHRAAIDWLNERTDEDTRFFGVEIEVVRIGNSDPAPAFKLVAQPNDWGKQVRAATAAATGEVSERSRLYWDFWTKFRERVLNQHPTWTKSTGSTKSSWFGMSAGTPNVNWIYTFSTDGLAVQLEFVDSNRALNVDRFEALLEHKEAIESAFGEPITWEPRDGLKSTRIAFYSDYADVADTTQWDHWITWLIDTGAKFRTALAAGGGVPLASGNTATVTLADIIHAGAITTPAELTCSRGINATLNSDATITVDGASYASVSSAARAVTGGSINGWIFWTLADDPSTSLDTLRTRIANSR